MATGPLPMLTPKHWWTSKLLLGQKETKINIRGIAINSEAEVFLADYANGVVRAIDVSTFRLDAKDDAYRVPSRSLMSTFMSKVFSSTTELVCRVAYSSYYSDTLFIGTELQEGNNTEFQELRLRSFKRKQTAGDGSGADRKWDECHLYKVLPIGFDKPGSKKTCKSIRFGTLQALSDGNLVVGVTLQLDNRELSRPINEASHELRLLSVAANNLRTVDFLKRIPILTNSDPRSIDAKRVGDETWFATALRPAEVHADANIVALYRIDGEKAIELFHYDMRAPLRLLFVGDDSLLVYARTEDAKGWEVHKLGIALDDNRGLINRGRVLHGRDTPETEDNYHPLWCTANGVLVAWNIEHDALATYSLNQ